MTQIISRKKTRSLKKSQIIERANVVAQRHCGSLRNRNRRANAFFPRSIFAILALAFLTYSFGLQSLLLLIAMYVLLGFLDFALVCPCKRPRRLAHDNFHFFGNTRNDMPLSTYDFNKLKIGDSPVLPEEGKNGFDSKSDYVLLESRKFPHFPEGRHDAGGIHTQKTGKAIKLVL